MNSKPALTKVGKLDLEINKLSKFLFLFMIFLSFSIVALSGFEGVWYINFFRFILFMATFGACKSFVIFYCFIEGYNKYNN